MKLQIGKKVRYIDNGSECDYPVGTIGVVLDIDYNLEFDSTVLVLFGTEQSWHYEWELEPIPSRISYAKALQ